MKKGQMSLEMIIGLLILLVVAVVVIRIFLTNIQNVNKPGGDMQTRIDELGFVSQCENLCNDYLANPTRAALAKYCYTKLTKINDLDKDGRVSSFTAATKVLPICEDGVYCFHVKECKTDHGPIDWKDCREVVCEAYVDVYGSKEAANSKVAELFKLGTCKGIADKDNWVKLYFNRGDDKPCTKPPGICIVRVADCKFKVDGTFECTGEFIKENCIDKDFIIGMTAQDPVTKNEFTLYVSPGNKDFSVPSGSNFIRGPIGTISISENKISGEYKECALDISVDSGQPNSCDSNPSQYKCIVCKNPYTPLTGYTCLYTEIYYGYSQEVRPTCSIV